MDIKVLKTGAIRGVFWKFAERIGARAVTLIVSVVLARILVPEDYSVVGVVTIFFSFSNVLISGGFNSALIQKKDADELDYSSATVLTLVLSFVIYVILFFSAGIIANVYQKPLLVPLIRVMSLTLFINSYKSVLCALVSSKLEFRKFFIATIIGTIISAGIGIAMAIKGFGPWALVAQQMSNSIVDTLCLNIVTKYKPRLSISLKRLRSLFSYGGKIYLASLITVFYDEIKPLIVGIRFSTIDLAFYTKGESFPKVINASVSETLAAVMFPVLSKVQEDISLVNHFTRRYMQICSYIVFPIMIGFFAIADNFVLVLLTEKWLPIVPYIRLFSFCYMFNVIQKGNLHSIKAIGRSDIILKLEIIKKASYLIILVIFVLFSKSPFVLATSTIITTALASAINAYPNNKLIKYSYLDQLFDLLPNLLLASIMGIIVFTMNKLPVNTTYLILFQILCGFIVYIVISVLTNNKNFYYLLDMLRKIINKKRIRAN